MKKWGRAALTGSGLCERRRRARRGALSLRPAARPRPYAAVKGREYEINGYTVQIEAGDAPHGIAVKTVGHLLD